MASGAPLVHTFHGTVFGSYFGERTSTAIIRTERFLARRTDRIVALSERQRAELLAYGVGSDDRIRIVPLGLDLDRFTGGDRAEARRRLGIEPGLTLVVAVGRLVPVKRLDRLVAAFEQVHTTVPSTRLVLVGDGSERRSLERQVPSAGLDGAVHFNGWASQQPLWDAAADVVTLTSAREGTPLALIEAAAPPRPVGAAGGGVWKTDDAGRTWHSLFDRQPASSVGALAGAPSNRPVLRQHRRKAPARAARAWVVAAELLKEAQLRGEPVAWVSARSSLFFPPDMAQNGIDPASITVVSVSSGVEAMRSADLLARSAAFGLIAVDLGRDAAATDGEMARLVHLARRHSVALLFLTIKRRTAASLSSLVSLHLTVRSGQVTAAPAGSPAVDEAPEIAVEITIAKDKRRNPGLILRRSYGTPPGVR